MTKKIGRDMIKTITNTRRYLSYNDLPNGKDEWVDADHYLPADYDMVYMDIKNKKVICGWSAGNGWESLRLRPGDKVLRWKRKQFEEEGM